MSNKFKLTVKTRDTETIVSQVQNETQLEKLNRLAKECGFDNIAPFPLETIRTENSGVQTLFNLNQNDAYILNPPVAGRIISYQREGRQQISSNFSGVVAFKRCLIVYGSMNRINNSLDMYRTLNHIINETLQSFVDEFGNLMYGYKVTGERAGQSGVYFTHSDNSAAYIVTGKQIGRAHG